ncbi:MAG TPA: selenocysteine-specific translation elongation factor [Silvibacterium sp.]|nr:selenocysteine-specific translation elongation factor [Silvibacterium sp.]
MKAASATRSVIVGTAGHIDHGKTALIYALTGTDTDRLPEEKRRGITIDLGFAGMSVPDGRDGETQVSFIDVPGHHAFVRNMLAGAGGIDCVLLVIAADEGVKAQTKEHLAICTLLGINRGLVVLTKKDAVVAERLEQTRQNAALFLSRTFLRDAPMLAVSAKTGEGMPELRHALGQLAANVPARSREFVPRLYPDRAFSMRGFGTVVTGTLLSGEMSAGSSLALVPGDREARVRGIQVHGQSVESAFAPCRVALNLAGIEPREIKRGHVLVPVKSLTATSLVDAEVSLLPGAAALKHRARVRFHSFTADIGATVLLYSTEKQIGGSTALVRLQLERPSVVVPGDRFVLRVPSPAETIGGGRVLDAVCRRGVRKAESLRWLERFRDASQDRQLELRIERRGIDGAEIGDLVRETGLHADAVREAVKLPAQRGQVIEKITQKGTVEFVVSTKALVAAEAAMLAHVSQAKNSSISRAELRSRTGLNEAMFELALSRLARAGKIEGGDSLALPGRSGLVNARLQKHADAVERQYISAGVAPPLLREVAERLGLGPAEMRDVITLLLRTKKLVRLGADDLYIHCDAIAKLSESLVAHRGEAFDVARFKSFTGLTRKHAIPLLEYLDRAHVTRNAGGTRIVV